MIEEKRMPQKLFCKKCSHSFLIKGNLYCEKDIGSNLCENFERKVGINRKDRYRLKHPN